MRHGTENLSHTLIFNIFNIFNIIEYTFLIYLCEMLQRISRTHSHKHEKRYQKYCPHAATCVLLQHRYICTYCYLCNIYITQVIMSVLISSVLYIYTL